MVRMTLLLRVFLEDETWYRSRVVDDISARGDVSVLFVDYGNTETVKLTDIRPCPTTLQRCPRVAVKCRLEGLKVKDVSAEMLATVKGLTEEKQCSCILIGEELAEEGKVKVVRLMVTNESSGQQNLTSVIHQIGLSLKLVYVLQNTCRRIDVVKVVGFLVCTVKRIDLPLYEYYR